MIIIKTREEIERVRVCCQMVREILDEIEEKARPGATTLDLDRIAEEGARRRGAVAAFKGYKNFPRSLCASVNEEVVHGIPSARRILEEGDIVSLDFGVYCQGYYGDSARTVGIGQVGERATRLMRVTKEALEKGVEQARVGKRVNDISAAVEAHVVSRGYQPVRDYVGHGLGRSLHEEPQVPNFGQADRGARLKVGMILAIEPMVNEGTWEVDVRGDGWTAVTKDGKLSAHFEYAVAVTPYGPDILTLAGDGGERQGLVEAAASSIGR